MPSAQQHVIGSIGSHGTLRGGRRAKRNSTGILLRADTHFQCAESAKRALLVCILRNANSRSAPHQLGGEVADTCPDRRTGHRAGVERAGGLIGQNLAGKSRLQVLREHPRQVVGDVLDEAAAAELRQAPDSRNFTDTSTRDVDAVVSGAVTS